MTPQPSQREQPRANDNSMASRFWRFPLVWMVIGVIGVSLVSSIGAVGRSGTSVASLLALAAAVVAVVIYWLVMSFVARRPTPEIGPSRAWLEVLSGAAAGIGFVLVSVLVITLLGGYSFSWSGNDVVSVLVPLSALSVGAAVTEELLFRGLALQALERLCGSWIALVITAAIFGGAHLLNPGATVWSSVAIAVEAGVLLGAAFLWRRSIWFVAGLHFAWNTVEGLLGIPISGKVMPGLLAADIDGPALLTGGDFGLEASVVPVAVSVLLAIPMIVLAHRRGTLVPVRAGLR